MSRDGRSDAQADGVCAGTRAESEAPKKIPETDSIFAHVATARGRAAADDACLRISIDSKAKVKIGDFSRGGRSRLKTRALDHDMHHEALLVPFGVLEVSRGTTAINQLNLLFGRSRELLEDYRRGRTIDPEHCPLQRALAKFSPTADFPLTDDS